MFKERRSKEDGWICGYCKNTNKNFVVDENNSTFNCQPRDLPCERCGKIQQITLLFEFVTENKEGYK